MEADHKPLDFDAIRRLVEQFVATPFGADAARELSPAPTLSQARQLQAAVTTARGLCDAHQAPQIERIPDVRPALRQAASPAASLSGNALANLTRFLQLGRTLEAVVRTHPGLYPGPPEDLQPPEAVVAQLEQTIHPGGSLREDASETLKHLHGERRRLREEAAAKVRERLRDRAIAAIIKDTDTVHWSGDRAVLAIHAKESGRIRGVRRGSQMGGRDALMEPMEVVPLNNQVEATVTQLSTEEQQVLRQATAVVAEHRDALDRLLTAITWVDLALAAGQLSAVMNAHPPELVEEATMHLEQAYHPVLLVQYAEGRGPLPVPLTVSLSPSQRILLITGPNTGGKTVALKTVGLLTVMAHCGLHIPAERDCRIGRYDRVLVDVGDRQSLFHHLSTFAGHVEVLKRILGQAGSGSLVLLDELGTGTDPEEGAALAMAVLDELTARGVQGMVNTHLAPLKDYAEHREGITNACMRFDQEQLRPTYELLIGEPGGSLGLLIAAQYGMGEALIGRARSHLQAIRGET